MKYPKFLILLIEQTNMKNILTLSSENIKIYNSLHKKQDGNSQKLKKLSLLPQLTIKIIYNSFQKEKNLNRDNAYTTSQKFLIMTNISFYLCCKINKQSLIFGNKHYIYTQIKIFYNGIIIFTRLYRLRTKKSFLENNIKA